MVIIHMVTGGKVEIPTAKSAGLEAVTGKLTGAVNVLVCKGDNEAIIARFRLDQIAGYVIESE